MPIKIREAPRGVLAGIKKDAENAKTARLTGEETRAHGVAWSHGYLNQKPWHPLSYRNQRDLFMAEEKTAKAAETNKQAQFEFEREQEFFRNAELMGDRERERVSNRAALSFMYQKPPGYEAMIEKQKEELAATKKEEEKAAALLTRQAQGVEEAAEEPAPRKKMLRDRYGNLVATAEMFPALKDAPKHESASDTAHATPFGVEIRMIQCKRCKQWGHNGTDRECPMRDQNPNDEFRQRLEDPLNLIKARAALAKDEKLKMKYVPGQSPLRGGGDRTQENQQILGPSDDDDDDGNPHTGNILDQLPKKERKRLLKDYIRNERLEKKTERRAKRAAAEAFLQQAGVRSESSKRAKKDKREKEEEKEKERSSKKSKESSKSKHKKHKKKKSKKHRKAETSSDSSSSSESSDSSDGSDSA